MLPWNDAKKLLQKTQLQFQERALRIDLLDYQINEITNAELQENEEETLREESKQLVSAQKLAASTYEIMDLAIESDASILGNLDKVRHTLLSLVSFDDSLNSLTQSIESLYLQLEDIFYQVSEYHSKVRFEPERIEQINIRLNLIQQIKRKYGSSFHEILEFLGKAQQERTQLEHLELEVEATEKRLNELTKELDEASQKLSKQRTFFAAKFDAQVCRQLHDLGMNDAKFQVMLHTRIQDNLENTFVYSDKGIDIVRFYFSANLGQEMRPLEKIASGGELSRVMLAIKTVLRQQSDYSSLIFDEIDSGISGRIAEMVGEKIRALSQEQQTICITHLPQIASFAQQHIVVSKKTKQGTVYTQAKSLQEDKAVLGLSKLIGGKIVSEQAVETAKDMLQKSQKRFV